MNLPYNKSLIPRARELRKNSTLSEVLLWNVLKQKRAMGFDFDRQKIIGNYIVDFYCAKLNLVLEIDGSSHDDKYVYDDERHKYLESLGLTVVHIDDKDIKFKMTGVLDMLEILLTNLINGNDIKIPFKC